VREDQHANAELPRELLDQQHANNERERVATEQLIGRAVLG
jgi:hypothetical protein